MIILVCGSRKTTNAENDMIHDELDKIHQKTPITTLIHGAAKGVDWAAHLWAVKNKIPFISCPADWDQFGRAAGPIRNKQMLNYKPDKIIAFPGGAGTKNMIKTAKDNGFEVIEYPPWETL